MKHYICWQNSDLVYFLPVDAVGSEALGFEAFMFFISTLQPAFIVPEDQVPLIYSIKLY